LTTSSSRTAASPAAPAGEGSEYLVVDEFLRDFVAARAIRSAFEMGVVDALDQAPRNLADLASITGGDEAGMRLLTGLLTAAGVVEKADDAVTLTERFRAALAYRDLIETKLDFIGFVLLDFIDRFNTLVTDEARFMQEAEIFRLFDYQKSTAATPQNYAWTKVWMRLTTALTRYEADACMPLYDFGKHRRMLDIGGNSGEFLIRACKAHPGLRGAVMDLPVVCEFGQDHVLASDERDRISFHPGSALHDPIPEGFDLISFKSMLHDWPEIDAIQFIRRAAAALEPGGTLLIFERGPLDFADGTPPLALLPILLFARSYRTPELYYEILEDLGFIAIEVQELRLDSPFFLLTAVKPGQP
jgi:SAM-dependent methyltransferase